MSKYEPIEAAIKDALTDLKKYQKVDNKNWLQLVYDIVQILSEFTLKGPEKRFIAVRVVRAVCEWDGIITEQEEKIIDFVKSDFIGTVIDQVWHFIKTAAKPDPAIPAVEPKTKKRKRLCKCL